MEVYWVHLPDANIETDGYVGITNNTKQRWAKHKCLASGSHHLKNAILKYNSDLIWEVIFIGSEEGCTQLEGYFRPEPDIGWNIRSGGKYYNPSEETKEKLRQANLGKKYSEETKAKRSISARKAWANPELKEQQREHALRLIELGLIGKKGNPSPRKGKKLSDEERAKTSTGLKKYYETNKPHNYINISTDIPTTIVNSIICDYLEGVVKFKLHKKYGLSRRLIGRIVDGSK